MTGILHGDELLDGGPCVRNRSETFDGCDCTALLLLQWHHPPGQMIENWYQTSREIASRCLARAVSGVEILVYFGGSGLLEAPEVSPPSPSPSPCSERSWSSKRALCLLRVFTHQMKTRCAETSAFIRPFRRSNIASGEQHAGDATPLDLEAVIGAFTNHFKPQTATTARRTQHSGSLWT